MFQIPHLLTPRSLGRGMPIISRKLGFPDIPFERSRASMFWNINTLISLSQARRSLKSSEFWVASKKPPSVPVMPYFAAAGGTRAAQIWDISIRVGYKRQLVGSGNDDKRPIVYHRTMLRLAIGAGKWLNRYEYDDLDSWHDDLINTTRVWIEFRMKKARALPTTTRWKPCKVTERVAGEDVGDLFWHGFLHWGLACISSR